MKSKMASHLTDVAQDIDRFVAIDCKGSSGGAFMTVFFLF
jgi:hypothetical protein